MTTWIVPCNLSYYDIRKGLADYGDEIEWMTVNATRNIALGDTVYIYLAAPIKALVMQCIVTDEAVSTPTQRHRDHGRETSDSWFAMKFLHNITPIPYPVLLQARIVNGPIQTARLLRPDQIDALEAHLSMSEAKLA